CRASIFYHAVLSAAPGFHSSWCKHVMRHEVSCLSPVLRCAKFPLCQQAHVDPKMRRTVIIPSKNNTEKILSSINNHVMILTTLFIILFTTRRGCDGNSKRSFDPSYR